MERDVHNGRQHTIYRLSIDNYLVIQANRKSGAHRGKDVERYQGITSRRQIRASGGKVCDGIEGPGMIKEK